MKLFILQLLAALFSLPLFLPAQTPDFCSAQASDAANDYLYRTRRERTSQLIAPSDRSTKVVRVQVHIIQTDEGTHGANYATIVEALEEANVAFGPANVILQECGPPNYIRNSDYVLFNGPGEEDLRIANDAAGAINIYFASNVWYKHQGVEYNVCGYAHFPEENAAGTFTGFTAISNSCIKSALIHELGHCFGLYHTHETMFGRERVLRTGGGANCSSTGDLMCDTEADPMIRAEVDNNCNYTGSRTDDLGHPYTPDPNNFMSYSKSKCLNYFSPQQLAAINYSAHNDYPNTECVTNCVGGGIEEFPYDESFELADVLADQSILPRVWQQDLFDGANWSRRSTATPSNGTGPGSAEDGSFYLYTEASGGNHNKDFGLVSPCFNLAHKTWATVKFSYHMLGSGMGTLRFQVSTDAGTNWTNLWSKSGNQSSSWKTATIDLGTYLGQNVRFRFFATTGNSFRSDIDIDNFSIDAGPYYAPMPYLTSFDSGELDKYWQTASDMPSGRIQVTPAMAVFGTHHVVMDVSTPGPLVTNEIRLGLKLAGEENVMLAYFWMLFNMRAYNEGGLYLSDDGGETFSFVYPMMVGPSNFWMSAVLNLSDIANTLGLELNDQFVIKWQYRGNLLMPLGGMAVDMVQVISGTSSALGGPDVSEEQLLKDMEAMAAEMNRQLPEMEMVAPIDCYPNPFRNTFTLNIPQSLGKIQTIQVIDLNGQVLYQRDALPASQQLELGSELPAGVYFIRVQTEQGLETIKMVKTGT